MFVNCIFKEKDDADRKGESTDAIDRLQPKSAPGRLDNRLKRRRGLLCFEL
jgi:hypothetical protein